MKKAGLVKYSEEWYDYHDKRSLIGHVITQSLKLEAKQLNDIIYVQMGEKIANGMPIDDPAIYYSENEYSIILNYNNNTANHNIELKSLYQEKRDVTIDYILENECRYDEFVENWVGG